VRGDIKSASGPEIRRDNVLEMERRRTCVVVTVSTEVERDPKPVDSGNRESTMVPIFEMIISHYR
jgi:hypothetical protein